MVADSIPNDDKSKKPWLFQKGNPGGPGRPRSKRDRVYGILDGLRERFAVEDDRAAFCELVKKVEMPDLIRLVSLIVPKQEDPDSMNVRATPEELAAAEQVWAHRLAAFDQKEEQPH